MGVSLSMVSNRSTTLKRLAAMRRAAKVDLLDIGEVIDDPSGLELDGWESARFDELINYEELEEAVDGLRRQMEKYTGGYKDAEYDVFLSARYSVVKQQLLIVQEANGKIVQVDDKLFVRTNYTDRIAALKEHLAWIAEDLKDYINSAATATT